MSGSTPARRHAMTMLLISHVRRCFSWTAAFTLMILCKSIRCSCPLSRCVVLSHIGSLTSMCHQRRLASKRTYAQYRQTTIYSHHRSTSLTSAAFLPMSRPNITESHLGTIRPRTLYRGHLNHSEKEHSALYYRRSCHSTNAHGTLHYGHLCHRVFIIAHGILKH